MENGSDRRAVVMHSTDLAGRHQWEISDRKRFICVFEKEDIVPLSMKSASKTLSRRMGCKKYRRAF